MGGWSNNCITCQKARFQNLRYFLCPLDEPIWWGDDWTKVKTVNFHYSKVSPTPITPLPSLRYQFLEEAFQNQKGMIETTMAKLQEKKNFVHFTVSQVQSRYIAVFNAPHNSALIVAATSFSRWLLLIEVFHYHTHPD